MTGLRDLFAFARIRLSRDRRLSGIEEIRAAVFPELLPEEDFMILTWRRTLDLPVKKSRGRLEASKRALLFWRAEHRQAVAEDLKELADSKRLREDLVSERKKSRPARRRRWPYF